MKLVACPGCHAQYDVTHVDAKHFECRCGERVENRDLRATEASVHRCGSCGAIVDAQADRCEYCGSGIVRDTRSLSFVCPECFARNPDSCRFCTACGVAFRPEPIPTDHVELPCPCCGCLMPVRQVGDVPVNECPQCNGLWVPDDRFRSLVDRAIEARRARPIDELSVNRPRVSGSNPAVQRVAYRKCPTCEAFMQRRNFQRRSGVIVDVCRRHGTWLDADELEQIAGFILSGDMAEAQAREAEARREEERRASAEAARVMADRSASRVTTTFEARSTGSTLGSLVDLLQNLLS